MPKKKTKKDSCKENTITNNHSGCLKDSIDNLTSVPPGLHYFGHSSWLNNRKGKGYEDIEEIFPLKKKTKGTIYIRPLSNRNVSSHASDR